MPMNISQSLLVLITIMYSNLQYHCVVIILCSMLPLFRSVWLLE